MSKTQPRSSGSTVAPAIAWRPLAMIVAAAILLGAVLGLTSARRLETFRDPITFWQDAVANQPDDAIGHNGWGYALFNAGRPQEAIDHLRAATRLQPTYVDAYTNWGNALLALGRHDEAIEQYEKSLQVNPHQPGALTNLGTAYFVTQRPPQQAVAQFRKALEIQRNFYDAHGNLGAVLLKTGQPQEALEHLQEATRIKPTFVAAWANLASAYAELQRWDQAIAAAEHGLDLARAQGDATMSRDLQSRVAFYQSSRGSAAVGPTGR